MAGGCFFRMYVVSPIHLDSTEQQNGMNLRESGTVRILFSGLVFLHSAIRISKSLAFFSRTVPNSHHSTDMAAGYARGFYKILWEATGLDPNENKLGTVVDFGCGTGLLTDKLRSVCSRVVALDVSTMMIRVLKDKIKSSEWHNVDVAAVVLAAPITDETTRRMIDDLEGTVDLIVASSVMTFVPEEDLEATMVALGRMLKPGGLFCHSDWPKSKDKHPDGMDTEKAESMYVKGGLTAKSTKILSMDAGGEPMEVFVGVAEKA